MATTTPVHPLDEAATARAVTDADGTLLRWNEGTGRLLGHAPEEAEGRPASGLLADRADPPGEPAGDRWNGTVALRHRDGHSLAVWPAARLTRRWGSRHTPDGETIRAEPSPLPAVRPGPDVRPAVRSPTRSRRSDRVPSGQVVRHLM
ncbi:PAS domain-containing protein [Streptomyces fagopyri]|uniref:PAS domain-containing protein n=1 Tax=Streptomyces fagopyri TaxID=2662397 RepID=UPI00340D287A